MRPSQNKSGTKAMSTTAKSKAIAWADDLTAAYPSVTTTPTAEVMAPKKPTYEMRMRQLSPVVRLGRKLEATAKRFSKIADEVKRWRNAPDLGEKATVIEMTLAAMVADATTMPDAFLPERERKAGPRQLGTGAKVALREKIAARYSGILESEGAATLEVVAVTRGHVSVRTSAGVLVVLPRAHVTMTAPASQPQTNVQSAGVA